MRKKKKRRAVYRVNRLKFKKNKPLKTAVALGATAVGLVAMSRVLKHI
jgi:hypothetical protein